MSDKYLGLKLKASYFLLAGSLSCYYAFLILFFKDRNLDYIQMGICFAALPLMGVACQPMWGYLTDKYLNKKISFIIVTAGSALTIILLVFSRSYYAILPSIILLALFMTSMNPLLDALCLEASAGNENIQFNRIRLMGSIGYALCVVIMGLVIKYTNINTAFYAFFAMNLLNIMIVSTIEAKGEAKSQRINPRFVLSLFKNTGFILLIASTLLLNIATGSNASYVGELIKTTGGDVSNLGLMWSVVTLCEVPTFFLGSWLLKRFNDFRLYQTALFFYSIRFLLNSLCTDWHFVIAVQVMQALTYALYMVATIHYLNRVIEPQMLTSGITLHAALGLGLGNFIGNIGGGVILELFNIYWLYRINVVICLISLSVALFIERRKTRIIAAGGMNIEI